MQFSNRVRKGWHALSIVIALLFVVGAAGSAASQPLQNQDMRVASRLWAVQVTGDANPQAVAAAAGMEYLAPIGSLPGYHLFRLADENIRPADGTAALASAPNVISSARQIGYPVQFADLTPNDPDYPDSWHLENIGQDSHGVGPGIPDQDIDIQDAWDPDDVPATAGYSGLGVVVGVIDDGIEYTHPELSHHYRADLDFDYTNFDDDGAAVGLQGDIHGTPTAGIIGAALNNGKCSAGIAHNADLVSLRMLGSTGTPPSPLGTDGTAAAAFSHRLDQIEVFNNSWGWLPILSFNNELPLTGKALETAALTGRGGLGAIHVFAAGNNPNRSTNHDPNTSSRFSVVVGGSNNLGKATWYSTRGSGVFVSAPTQGGDYDGFDNGIYTADIMGYVGFNSGSDRNVAGGDADCTSDFGGTSAAAPVVTGVIALMLEANPNLSWRDVKHILAQTSEQLDATALGADAYQTNGAGLPFSHAYGFGRVNAGASVAAAETWTNIPPEITLEGDVISLNQVIPATDNTGLISTYSVDAGDLPAGFVAEHIVVRVDMPHGYPAELSATLTSPSGIVSKLLSKTNVYAVTGMTNNYPLLTVANWGEDADDLDGTWTFRVVDNDYYGAGSLKTWQLVFYGYIDSTLNPATNLIAAPSAETSVMLNWLDNAVDETGFRVERTTDPNTLWAEVTTVPANTTSYSDTGLTACTRYFYRVIAVKGMSSAPPSNTANVRPKSAAGCEATTFTLLRPGPDATIVIEPEVAFANPGGISQFRVFIRKPNGETRFVFKVDTNELATYCTPVVCSVDLAALDPALILKHGLYGVQVRVRFTDQTTAKSKQHQIYMDSPDVPRLLTPADWSVLEDPEDFDVLEWKHVDTAIRYSVTVEPVGKEKIFTARLNAPEIATHCVDGKCSISIPASVRASLKNRTTYLWRVIAKSVRGSREAPYATLLSLFLQPPDQLEPTFNQQYVDRSSVRFVWSAVADATSYTLRVGRYNYKNEKWTEILNTKINSDTVPNLETTCDAGTERCTYTPTEKQLKKFRPGLYAWYMQVRDSDYKATSYPIQFLIHSPYNDDTPIAFHQSPAPNALVSATPIFGWAVNMEVNQHKLTVSGGDTVIIRTFDHADICNPTQGLEGFFLCSVDFNNLPGTGETEMLPEGEYQWFVTTTLDGTEYDSKVTSFTVTAQSFRAP